MTQLTKIKQNIHEQKNKSCNPKELKGTKHERGVKITHINKKQFTAVSATIFVINELITAECVTASTGRVNAQVCMCYWLDQCSAERGEVCQSVCESMCDFAAAVAVGSRVRGTGVGRVVSATPLPFPGL